MIAVVALMLRYSASAEESNITRLAGEDRYETAIAISNRGWTSSKYAVLARGDSFPDALCASPLAKRYDAPILLTDPARIQPEVLDEIIRLHADNVIIIGGEGAVSKDIEETLKSKGMHVDRIWGADRYETSSEIARRIGTKGSIAIATGEDFPDALSISAPAAINGMPILLSEKARIPDKVKSFISDNNQINKTYIIGGRGVVSDAILDMVPGPERICGNDRYETNAAVMSRFSTDLNFTNLFLSVADGPNGDEFADALSGSALAAKTSSPVVLVYKKLSPPIDYLIRPMISKQTKLTVLGGVGAVQPSIVDNLLYGTGGRAAYVKIVDPPKTIKSWQSSRIYIDADPDAQITAYSSNTNVAVVSTSGRYINVTGISPGWAVITVEAKKAGYSPGNATMFISSPVYNATRDSYYDTIQKAVDYAYAGDVVRISPGVYYEHVKIKSNNIKLIGEDRDSTIIDATQSGGITRAGIKIQYYSGIEVKNLTVRNAGINVTGEESREPYGIYAQKSSQNMFDNLMLKSNGTYEMYFYDGSSYNTVQNCILDGAGTERDGYRSLDGIFSCGGESESYSAGIANSGNRFLKNVICNVVNGISLTASNNSWIMDNEIHAMDSTYWKDYSSTGLIISNGSMNLVQNNLFDSSQNGIRLSALSSMSPYAYAGSPNNNIIRENDIASLKSGIKIVGNSNTLEYNTIDKAGEDGIWLTQSARNNKVSKNILSGNATGMLVENVSNSIHLNSITGGTTAVKNTVNADLDVTKNWWGDVSNPRNLTSGRVIISPWALNEDYTEFSQ